VPYICIYTTLYLSKWPHFFDSLTLKMQSLRTAETSVCTSRHRIKSHTFIFISSTEYLIVAIVVLHYMV